MSVKANYNIETPLLWLARKLVGDDNVKFMESPSHYVPPMAIFMDPAQIARLEADMMAAANVPLPDEDEDL
ncbi:GTP-binding nuclear protein Ran [Saprolegnia diclina VS20]|uniref:GTP-binding nuclear protein Ran n=1 Tax=Saprolegnia diclina (strain VS20) TaxID=1156394 RepID=T0RH24_SAPDV|nr:GTP-binding nuclear protein Ran [Saprolegnia diclina VS20]EQC31608.1 GTP-binding nuclear protein Ran [Saprolegnia diclina VS20]|eukprot:XP_008615007.1 GTP-binding nuclear protein Ran [Saprolegnia diclina VS20]